MAVLPAVLALAMIAIDRLRSRRANFPGLLLLAYVGTWLHVFMDFLNSYGVRLLMPFSNQWFYGDALYIVDPLLYLFFGGAIVAARIAARRGHPAPLRLARTGLVIAGAYVLIMLASNVWARSEVRRGLTRAGRSADTRFMVTPVFGNPFRREVIIDVGARYEKGLLWFEPLPHFRPAGFGVNKGFDVPEVQQALQLPLARAYLRWARFPFVQVNAAPPLNGVWLNDYRYAGAAPYGWSAVKLQ
jgi:inner membrane protein